MANTAAIDWGAALEQHRPWLRKVLRNRVRDRHAVEDLFQEVALAVFRNASRRDGKDARPTDPSKVAPWLYRLAVRQTINFHRKSGRKSMARPIKDLDPYDATVEPLDWMMGQERSASIANAMQQLKTLDRELLTLKYTENWNYKKIAQHLGVKVSTVEYRLHQARKQLRRKLSDMALGLNGAKRVNGVTRAASPR